MKPSIKIRFTEPQIALVMRAHPNCNLDRLTELSFEFDRAGRLLIASAQSRTAGMSITTMPAAGSRACTRRHAADWQLDKPVQRYCNFQTARDLPMRNLLLDNGCASRVGLTPSPTCLPGQGGSRKGMRPFGNETGRAIVSPPRSNRWRVFYVEEKGN